MRERWITGIDEVGRGPLAGPVTVAACAVEVCMIRKLQNTKTPLRDSKKLSSAQREQWFKIIQKLKKQRKIMYAVANISPKIIDTINITCAANRAATRAYTKLITKNLKLKTDAKLYLDGGLYLEEPYKKLGKTIIKGDEKISAISLASIIAKVMRDRYMEKMHIHYPHYCFHTHKGYGTRAHYKALLRHGASPLHRKTFLSFLKSV